jgi:hypothetical protein
MGYFNPFIDPFKIHLTNKMPVFDGVAYKLYPEHNFVYDKLWVVRSQGLPCGRLEKLKGKENSVEYPIFIKPRYGHLSASSKNCFKIHSAKELQKYLGYKHMMWSGFLDANETMTDFVMLHGKIVHQITYKYSEKQNGFTDDWKLISPYSEPPESITGWVQNYMKDFTGVVNVQYRAESIIEVGLRLSRGGAYIVSTQNKALIENINNIFLYQKWDYSLGEKMVFKPFYAYKCFTKVPILYLFPQKIMDMILRKNTPRPFYEYYFEPAGKSGMVFYQFMDDNFERGMQTKKYIEHLFTMTQLFFLGFLSVLVLGTFYVYKHAKINKYHQHILCYGFTLFLLLLSTRLLNPISANYSLFKAQKQNIFGGGPVKGKDDDDDQDDETGRT